MRARRGIRRSGSSWSFSEDIPELGRAEPHEIPASSGLGGRLSYAVRPDLALFAAGSVGMYGSESGYNTYEGGVEARVPRPGARVLPFVQASVGRLHWSGGMSYTFAGLGAGAELFVSERGGAALRDA